MTVQMLRSEPRQGRGPENEIQSTGSEEGEGQGSVASWMQETERAYQMSPRLRFGSQRERPVIVCDNTGKDGLGADLLDARSLHDTHSTGSPRKPAARFLEEPGCRIRRPEPSR